MHSLALIASFYNHLPAIAQWTIATLVVLSWGWDTYRKRAVEQQATILIELHQGKQWFWTEPGGNQMKARLLASSVINKYAVFVHFDLGRAGKRYLMIRRQQLEPEAFRQLRVAMKICKLDQ